MAAILERVGRMDAGRNNLDRAASPYLRQHRENPIWWQEWTPETLADARQRDRIIFVSVGYATCHWCHVMAAEAFSDREIADYLNRHFLAIKVDREERPDLDHYLMSLALTLTGSGGWPLNVFLTPDLTPILALTYAPVRAGRGLPGFLDVLAQARELYAEPANRLPAFTIPPEPRETLAETELVPRLERGYDARWGGFGGGAKFPPHSQLLLLLAWYPRDRAAQLETMLTRTLDAMLWRGLHDHLQGGFFRYCVDRAWTIPHFEKLLTDQALLLWIYALAARRLGNPDYAAAARKTWQCLAESFAADGLFVSGHDADTGHREGETYLWTTAELRAELTPDEYAAFREVYAVTDAGNFEGKNHLLKNQPAWPATIEARLLAARRRRPQPFTDRKTVTAANALVGIGLVHAARYLEPEPYLGEAIRLWEELRRRHDQDGHLWHSSIDGRVQRDEFLEDHAAVLLLLTYLHEETGRYAELIREYVARLDRFREGGRWLAGHSADAPPIPAPGADYSLPSAASLAEVALARSEILLGTAGAGPELDDPRRGAFGNLAALMRGGWYHVIQTPRPLAWRELPINAIQVPGPQLTVCYRQRCSTELPRSAARGPGGNDG